METGIHSKLGAQVYMRWVGTRDGERFESMATGPWGVLFDGNVVLLDHADDVQLEHERDDLEKRSSVSSLLLEVAAIRDGERGEWKAMINARRDVSTGLDVGRNVWRITEMPKGDYYTHRVEVQATNVEIVNALSQQYGVVENWCEGHTAGGLLLAVNFRIPA